MDTHSNTFLNSFFERLEDRVLFDGVPDGAFIAPEAGPQPSLFQAVHSIQSEQVQAEQQVELIVIDSGIENGQLLLDSLLASKPETSFEVRILNSNEDGVRQISEWLSASDNQFDAIHVLSHGTAGNIELGSSSLNLDNFNRYQEDLSNWSKALSDNADILFYGCELAGNQSGRELIEIVSQTTGADVAASTDLTGDSEQNANWKLEFVSGHVETLSLSSANWQGTLAVEATDGIVTIQDAENSAAGTITLTNNGAPEVVTVLNTPTRVGQMLERVWQFNETADTGRATYVFDVSGVAGFNATIASEFGLIISDQFDLADGPNTTTLVASGYDAANGLVYFHQIDLNPGDYFGLATEVELDNFSIFPTATGLEDTSIDLGLVLSPSLTLGGQLQDIIATDTGFRASSAGTTSTDFFIPAGTTGIRVTGYSTRDIGTGATDIYNDDYQFLNASIDLETETSNGYIGHIIDQGPTRSDQFGWEEAPLGTDVLTGGGTITGDASNNINPTFTIVDGVLQITENHQLQTAYHVEFLTNATSSSEFIQTESAVLESNDLSLATLGIPANADFLVVNITDAAAGSNFAIEYKGNSRVVIDLATLRASGVVAAEEGETDTRVVAYAFEDYDVSSAGVGSILSAAGTVVGDTTGEATVINDNQIYINGAGDLVIDRDDSFASRFNSLITVEYYERRPYGSSAEQLGESTEYGFWNSDPSNPTSTLEFDIPDNATLGILNLTQNGTNPNDTNENSGAGFAVIDLVNGNSSGSIYFVRASSVVDLVGWNATPFGTEFFSDPNSISNHNAVSQFNDPFAGTAAFNLINGGTTLEMSVNSDSGGTGTFLDYNVGGQIQWYGAAPFEVSGSVAGGSFSQGTLNPVTGNYDLTIAEASMGLAYIPPAHVSGNIPVDVTLRIGDETEVTAVTIQAVIDPISFAAAPDACGDEDTDITISPNVTPVFVDQDGSETLTALKLSNVPIGHTISDGTNTFVSSAGSQSVDITAWNQGTLTYRANPNETGTFTISMDVDWQDVGGGVTDTDSMTTTFDVIVKPINDPPVAVDDFYTVLGNTALNVPLATGLLNNDSDVENDPLTVNTTPVSGPSNGSVTINANGTFTYVPNTGFSGTDSFEYQVSDGNGGFDTATAYIDVSEPVTGPLNAVDDAVMTNEETLINIVVMANDALPTTGAFNIQSTTPPTNGVITVLANGTIDYTPNVDFFGVDTFTYTLADASGRTSTATVTVTVKNVQDPPIANADSGSTPEDTTLPNINILANDSDPDNDMLTVTMATPGNGMVTINPDGTIDYTPNAGFFGTDTITYTITDGNGGFATSTVLINVAPVADPPTSADNTVKTDEEISYTFVASDFAFADQDPTDSLVAVRIDSLPADGQLLANGNPATAGQVVSLTDINNGNVIFVPDPDENGNGYATFDFSVSDGNLFQTSPNTMTIDVCPIQDPPVATDNSITANEESIANPLGLATPTDIDGDTLTATVTGLPTLGTVYLADGVTVVNNGDMLTMVQLTSLVYDAPTVFTAANAGSFTYDVTDGIDTDSGQVDITIVPVNDAPVVDLNGGAAGEDYADTFTEGGAPVEIVDPTVSVTDEDDTTFPLLKIDFDETTISDAGEEFLTIGGTDFQLDAASNSTIAVPVGGNGYNVAFTAATARFDITRTDGAEMTAAEAQAILLATTYRNDSVLPTVGNRNFDVCVNDGDVDSNIATTTITVVRDSEVAEWSISGAMMVFDGNNATYTVELSAPLRDGETALVDLGLMDIDTTGADYGPLNTAVAAAVAAYTGPGTLTWSGTTLTFTSDGTGVMAPLSIVLPTTPDSVYEGDEDFKISLSNPASTTGETITIDPAADEVVTTIKDNTPAPTVTIGDGSAIEGSPVAFTISLDVPSFEPITLNLAAATGSATAGADFETTNFEYFDGINWVAATAGTQVTIPAGQTSLMVRVDTVQEGLVEPNETFTLSASVVSGTTISVTDTGSGTIFNDDVPEISIDDVSVDEDNGTMTFTISLDQASVAPVAVDWATASGIGISGATSGVDFTAASGTANFASGMQTQTVTIAITQDNLYEGPHTFDVNLSNPSGGTIVDGTGVGTIYDNGSGPNGSDDDRPVISINDATDTETVDPFALFTVSLSNPSIEDIDVSLALMDVTATSGADYGPGLEYFDGTVWQPVTGNVTIAAGATSLDIRTPIIDDPIADNNETYSVIVTHVSGTTANTGDTGTGTILEDPVPDPTYVSITGDPSVTEGGIANYNLALTNAPLTPVTITFNYTGTASGGTDYSGVASVTIPAGSTTGSFSIPTINDTLGEPLENFTITIASATGGSLEDLQIDPTDFEVVTDIIDDDVPAIAVNDVLVTEGADPFAEFTVELSNPTYENIDFDISAMGVTANGEVVDYGIVGLNELEFFDGTNWIPATAAMFAPGDITILMRTPIVDDAFAEPVETFTVTATVTGGTTSNPFDDGTGTIQDDTSDPETVLVSLVGPPSVVEGAATTPYTLALTDPGGLAIIAAQDITVTLAYTGVAADGSDFTGVATVLIPASSSSATFTLPTVNDSLYEDTEDIIISITTVTGGGFEGIAANPMADTVTTLITDVADIPTVSVNNVTSIEGTDNFAVYTAELSNLSVEDVDVNLSLSNGTASGLGVDFGAAGATNLQVFDGLNWVNATTATIAAGDQFVQVRIPIVDDPINEPTENYALTVDVTAGTTTNIQVIGTGTIIDDDPAPDVTIADATASEGDPLVFNVTLSNPSSQPIVLDFAASNSTATAATDYNTTAFEYSTDGGATWIPATGGSEATIPANSTAIQVRLLTTEDMTLETTETMELAISSVVSGLAGNTTDTAVGTIIDDDSALVSIVANDPIACEPSDHGQFTVSMSNPSDSPTVISYSVSGTAANGIDYAALSGTITLPAGVTSGTIDLTVIDDSRVEGIEDVTITLTSITSGDADISIDTVNNSDTVTIKDDDTATWALTGDTTVNEGANATYNVTLTGTLQAGESTSVDLTISDTTTTPADYVSFSAAVASAVTAYAGPGILTWDGTALTFTSDGTGQMAPLVIDLMAVNDVIVEGVEQYNVSISNSATTTGITVNIDTVNNSVDTEIQDTIDAVGTSLDKASWSIAGATSVNEASTTNYTITIDATLQSGEIAEVDLSLTHIETTAGDVTALNAAVTAAVATYNSSGPGTLSWDGTTLSFVSDGTGPMGNLIVQIVATADGFLEGPEDYSISLVNPNSTTGSCIGLAANDSVTTTINPDTTAAEWSIAVDNSDDEGATVQYDVELTQSFGAGDSAEVDLALNDVDTNSTDYGNFLTAVNNAIAAYTGPGTLAFDGTTLTYTATADGDMMTGLTIDLDLTDDPIVEGTETFTVDLSNPAGPTGVNVTVSTTDDSVTTTINDTIGFGGAPDTAIWSIMGPTTGNEGGTVSYMVGLSGALGLGESVSVDLNLNDLTTNSSDYASIVAAITAAAAANPDVTFSSASGTLTYTAPTDGATMTPLTINLGLSTDSLVEGSQNFQLELTNVATTSGAAVSIDPTKDDVVTTIVDQTAPAEWSIIGPAFEDEGGTAQYLVLLNGNFGAGETATVDVGLTDISTNSADYGTLATAVNAAIAGNPDVTFDATTGELTYTAPTDGATMPLLVVGVSITNDVIVEGTEQYTIALTNPGSTTGAVVGVSATDDSVTTTINDTQGLGGIPDAAEWSITGSPTVGEGANAAYKIALAGGFGAGESVSVDLGFSDVDTTSSDYAGVTAAVNNAVAAYAGPGSVMFDGTTLTFAAAADGELMDDLVVDLLAIDDTSVEGSEDYTIELTNAATSTGAAVSIEAANDFVTTTIIDNDTAAWNLTGDVTVGEGANAKYIVNLIGTLQAGETATIELYSGNVDTAVTDYASFASAINAAISSYSGPGSLAFDGTTLTFTSNGNPMGDLCIEINATDDPLVEGSEDYQVSIANPGSTTGSAVATSGPTIVMTTITDNDTASWGITGDTTVGEGTNAKYTLDLAGTLQAGETATIELYIGNLTSISPDYANFATAVNTAIVNYAGPGTFAFDGTTLTFTSDGNPMDDLCIEVTAIDDTLVEGSENYQVSIANPGTTTGSAIVTSGPTTVVTTITDDDTATWSIAGDATVGEGADAKYLVSLAGTLQAGETATIELYSGNVDTTSADYANFVAAVNVGIAAYTGPGALAFDGTTLTFTSDGNPMGDLCIEVTAVDDTLVEGSEDYQVSIANPGSTTGSAVVTGGTTIVSTTITDNDTSTWSITGDAVVPEGASAKYIVNLAGALQTGETATVELAIGDTDTTSADYANFVGAVNNAISNYSGPGSFSFNGTTLTFTSDGNPMGDLCIELLAVDDTLAEGPEDFSLSLSNPDSTTGSNIVTDPSDTVTTTIQDNDSVLWSIMGTSSVDEGGTAQYTISLDGILQTAEDSSVMLTLSDLDTTSADYANFAAAVQTAVSTRTDLAFDAATGRLTATGTGTMMANLFVNLDAIDDTVIEGAERYQVLLSNSTSTTGSVTGIDPVKSIVTTTINDTVGDGGVPETGLWSIGVDQTVPEGNPGVYQLNLAGALQSGEVVTIDLKLSDVDTVGTDYASFDNAMIVAVANYVGPGSLVWDGTTLRFTSDGTGAMAPLPISLGTVNDAFAEGAEDFIISLCNANSLTGAATGIDSAADDVVTTINDTTGPGADEVTWSIVGDNNVDEGGTANYTISITNALAAGDDATVELSIGDIDTNSTDYAGFNAAVVAAVANYNSGSNPGSVSWDGTTMTFTAAVDGDLLTGLVIDLDAIDDAFLEGPEVYDISLSNPSSNSGIVVAVDPSLNTVFTTINDTDGDGGLAEPGGEWSLTGIPAVTEGDPITFTVGLTGNLQAGESTTVQLNVADIETTGSDYGNVSASVTAAVSAYNANPANAGTLSWDGTFLTFASDGTGPMNNLEVTFASIDDLMVEGNERLNLILSNPSSPTGLSPTLSPTNNVVITTIIDNDFPEWSVTGPAMTAEGSAANYTILLDGVFQAGEVVAVDLGISDIDTTSGDYGNWIAAVSAASASNPDLSFNPTTGTLTYTAPLNGATMADLVIALPITSDGISEAPEDFIVTLSSPASSSGLSPTIDPAADDVLTTINGSPVTNSDDYFTNIDTPHTGNVLTNDSDPDGDILTVTEVDGQPIGSPIVTDCGTVLMNTNGSFTFIPFPGFSGIDVFEYTVVDAYGNEQTETVTIIVSEARIGSAKSAADAVPNGDNWDLTFTIVVENLGNAPLDNLSVLDDVTTKFGSALVSTGAPTVQNFSGSGASPTINTGWIGDTSLNMVNGGLLQPGDSFEVVFTITIDPDASAASQNLGNQATVSGQGINPDGSPMTNGSGNPVIAEDDSDNGTNPEGENGSEESVDGIPGNDITGIVIADLGIAKAIVGEPHLTELGNYIVTYRIVVENTGTVNLANLSLLEDLTTQLGSAFVNSGNLILATAPSNLASSISVNSAGWNGSSQIEMMDVAANNLLVTGDSFAIQFDVEVNPRQVSGSVGNQVEGSGAGVDANGDPLLDGNGDPVVGSDLSDSGKDPGSSNPDDPSDTGSSDDVSEFVPPEVPLGEISGVVFLDDDGDGIQDPGEGGIEGVEIVLTGSDVFGNSVQTVVLTDASGRYSFGRLKAGTYAISQTQPSGFTDGLENGNSAWTITDDMMSNIQLGWGQAFGSSSFAERFSGTSGSPPNLPWLPPLALSPISDLISSYLAGPGPIYSGTPLNGNARPLSFDSGRPLMGGYQTESGIEFENCECACPEVVNPCGDLVDPNGTATDSFNDIVAPTEGIIFDGAWDEIDSNGCETVETTCEALACDEIIESDFCDQEQSNIRKREPLLKRFANWLSF